MAEASDSKRKIETLFASIVEKMGLASTVPVKIDVTVYPPWSTDWIDARAVKVAGVPVEMVKARIGEKRTADDLTLTPYADDVARDAGGVPTVYHTPSQAVLAHLNRSGLTVDEDTGEIDVLQVVHFIERMEHAEKTATKTTVVNTGRII